uniref:Family with sequence similarity 184 member A n=1 Tax=Meleagris gallopavo TaxID=9103 RepID=A0A803XPG7_MELGA
MVPDLSISPVSQACNFIESSHLLKENHTVCLEEMEEKYKNRESRPEDLQLISELKDLIAERDQLIKKLIEDKKFYQLELVNRETNYNKVFNASPNVGVINPLVKVCSMDFIFPFQIGLCFVLPTLLRLMLHQWLHQIHNARSGLPGTSHSER